MAECRVCAFEDREKIDLAIANGQLPMVTATIWSQFEAWEISKHRDDHMHGIVMRVPIDPMRLIHRTQDVTDIALENLRQAQEEKKGLNNAIASAIRAIEMEAKLTQVGKHLDPAMLLPMWRQMQQTILNALEAHPEARNEVLQALEHLSAQSKGMH